MPTASHLREQPIDVSRKTVIRIQSLMIKELQEHRKQPHHSDYIESYYDGYLNALKMILDLENQ